MLCEKSKTFVYFSNKIKFNYYIFSQHSKLTATEVYTSNLLKFMITFASVNI